MRVELWTFPVFRFALIFVVAPPPVPSALWMLLWMRSERRRRRKGTSDINLTIKCMQQATNTSTFFLHYKSKVALLRGSDTPSRIIRHARDVFKHVGAQLKAEREIMLEVVQLKMHIG